MRDRAGYLWNFAVHLHAQIHDIYEYYSRIALLRGNGNYPLRKHAGFSWVQKYKNIDFTRYTKQSYTFS